MCGIFGIIYKENKREVHGDWLRSIISTLSHRGPDDEGIFIDRNVGLGHRRLSIIDLEGGHQPLFNEDRSIVVVFNGEIYNFNEIRKELVNQGHDFKTISDTEVIVHAYEEYGKECLKKFRGMFAFALYDKKRDVMFMARDRVGIKPLYFFEDRDVFIFSSEIKALLKTKIVPPEINERMLDFYLSLGFVPGPETLFKSIYKLQPGYLMWYENNHSSSEKYWDIDHISASSDSFDSLCDQLEEILRESVRLRLISDVPLGVFLSGGLDSSAIVAMMSEATAKIETFSVGYAQSEASELEYARIIADKFKTDHHEFILTSGNFFDSIDELIEYSEEPIVESAAISLCQLAKLARKHVTVLLCGEGADELFAGYQLYKKNLTMEKMYPYLQRIPLNLLRKGIPNILLSEKIQRYLDWASCTIQKRYKTVSHQLASFTKTNMYTESFLESVGNGLETYFEKLWGKVTERDPLEGMLFVDIKSWLPDDLLLKADKMTMAASVELRVPFLDHHLVEFAMSVPSKFKYNRTGKYILKKVMEKYIPKEIVYRTKRGFPVPVSEWLRDDLSEQASDILLSNRSLKRGYFREKYITELFRKHNKNEEDLSRRIFSLLVFEMWMRKYIDG